MGVSSSSTASAYRGSYALGGAAQQKKEVKIYAQKNYDDEQEYKIPSFDDYKEKLHRNDYEFENPYSMPKREDKYGGYERQHSRGNISGKTTL